MVPRAAVEAPTGRYLFSSIWVRNVQLQTFFEETSGQQRKTIPYFPHTGRQVKRGRRDTCQVQAGLLWSLLSPGLPDEGRV